MVCLFFGCWNESGHFLWLPGGARPSRELWRYETFSGQTHLDGTLAPRQHRYERRLCWVAQGATREAQTRLMYDSTECLQGQFLRHDLDTGVTALQWWDRTQGDERGACNSTILLEGRHTSVEMLAALTAHFPHVVANMNKAGVALVEVMRGDATT